MAVQSNLLLSLHTLLIIIVCITHVQCFHRSKTSSGNSSDTTPQQLIDNNEPHSIIQTGKCQTSFYKFSAYSSIERTIKTSISLIDHDSPEFSIVTCVGLSNNLTFTLNHIPSLILSSVKSIQVFNSSVPILNLEVFHRFPRLQEISVTHSSVSLIRGSIPRGILRFNLSFNHIRDIDSGIFYQTSSHTPSIIIRDTQRHYGTNETPVITDNSNDAEYDDDDNEDIIKRHNETLGQAENSEDTIHENASTLREIDLSYNKFSEIPPSVFHLKGLRSLRIAGNQFKCEFVWEELWDWLENQPTKPIMNILPDAGDAFCGFVDDVRVFQYSVLGVLKAKNDLEQACGSVDKNLCPECSLYALQREQGQPGDPVSHKKSPHGKISISLKVGCASRNLTQLPPIPHQTWQLNISHNFIRDLSPLKDPMYKNLLILDGDNNQINLETIVGTPFVEKYNYLSLQNNQFTFIPPDIFSSFEPMRGQGITFFSGNLIDCDCEVAKTLRPLLIENSRRIKDMRDIYCKEESKGDGRVRVRDLQIADVCYIGTSSDSSPELYLYLIIAIEVFLIILVIAKVWYDQRTFRRTGVLPWLSSCMPRLPCDAILESVKERPNFNNRPSLSVHSSSTNVHSTSVAFQTRGGGGGEGGGGGIGSRSNVSIHSDKSRQSHFSSFPLNSSSRTSPV